MAKKRPKKTEGPDDTVKMCISMPRHLEQYVKQTAKQLDRPVSSFLRQTIELYREHHAEA